MPRVSGTGRKSKSEWSEVLGAEGTKKVTCKHCNSEISGKIERIIAHLNKCPKQVTSLARSEQFIVTSCNALQTKQFILSM